VVPLEAVAAVREGVRCVSLAYPQGGEVHQDVAALCSIRTLAHRYLGADIEVFPVLHEFLIETIISTGGVLVPPPGYLAGLRSLRSGCAR
jgi:hypothetical protein